MVTDKDCRTSGVYPLQEKKIKRKKTQLRQLIEGNYIFSQIIFQVENPFLFHYTYTQK